MLRRAIVGAKWRHRSDQRGAFTLVELITACGIGIIVLGIATGMLTTLMSLSIGETNKNDAQIKSRQTVETAMRYLKNAVPLTDCERFTSSAPAGVNKSLESDVSNHCAKYGSLSQAGGSPIIRATPTEVEFYAMPEQAKPGRAPNRYVLRQNGTRLEVAMKAPASTGRSTVAAACADLGGSAVPAVGCANSSPDMSFWGTETMLASVDLGATSSFGITYLDAKGNQVIQQVAAGSTCAGCKDIRTVLIDGSVQYADRNRTSKPIMVRAEAAIRSSTYADRVSG